MRRPKTGPTKLGCTCSACSNSHKCSMGLGIVLSFCGVERVVVTINPPSEVYERGSGDQSRSPPLIQISTERRLLLRPKRTGPIAVSSVGPRGGYSVCVIVLWLKGLLQRLVFHRIPHIQECPNALCELTDWLRISAIFVQPTIPAVPHWLKFRSREGIACGRHYSPPTPRV